MVRSVSLVQGMSSNLIQSTRQSVSDKLSVYIFTILIFLVLAYILQKDSKVKEIYLADGDVVDSKYLLFIYDNGEIVLKWCYEDIVEIQEKPSLTKVGRRMVLEYGEPNLFDIRQRIAFQDELGNLEERWEKIM